MDLPHVECGRFGTYCDHGNDGTVDTNTANFRSHWSATKEPYFGIDDIGEKTKQEQRYAALD